MGRRSRARHIEFREDGSLTRTVSIDVPRPDVAGGYATAEVECGFWTMTGTLGRRREFTIDVFVVLDDGSRIRIGSVRGRRGAIGSGYDPRLRPLMLTSLGRTGTTMLMRLLSAHPAVVAYDAFPYEIFPAKYWLHMLRVLSEPANHRESAAPTEFFEDPWTIGHNPFHTAPITDATAVRHFLGRGYVRDLAAFTQRSIDHFYGIVGAEQGKAAPVFFIEKFHPDHVPRLGWDLYSNARELVLVRDPRDMICSILAFNAKRRTISFGRERFPDDEAYVHFVARRMGELVDAWRERQAVCRLVRYEEIVTRPAECAESLLRYLGLEAAHETISMMVERAVDGPALAAHRTAVSAEASIGRWRNDLPPSIRGVCEQAFESVITDLGYDGAEPARPPEHVPGVGLPQDS